jgi:2-oxoglutarate ferredoxin oxidoreductase subunit alpha
LIKGGHNFSVIRVSNDEHFSVRDRADFLLAMDENTTMRHEKSLQKKALVVFNSDKVKRDKGVGIAAETITKELGGISIMSNTALIAGFSKALGIEWMVLEDALRKEIKKGLEKNLEIAHKAYEQASQICQIEKLKIDPNPLLTGNELLLWDG